MPSRITVAERHDLVDNIIDHTAGSVYELIKKAKNRNELLRYTGILGLMGAFNFEGLQSRQTSHIKKMIGLEANLIKEKPRRPKGAGKLWAEVIEVAGDEVAAAKTLIRASDTMPRSYKMAHTDLQAVRKYVSNPLLMALRQSMQEPARD